MELKLKHTLEEMARVGKFDNIEIMVYSNEGPTPHFHFKDVTSKKIREGCIRIDIPDYFSHGKYKAIFTKDEKEELIKFLNSDCRFMKVHYGLNVNNYSAIRFLWDMNNPAYEIGEEVNMPNYEELSIKG